MNFSKIKTSNKTMAPSKGAGQACTVPYTGQFSPKFSQQFPEAQPKFRQISGRNRGFSILFGRTWGTSAVELLKPRLCEP